MLIEITKTKLKGCNHGLAVGHLLLYNSGIKYTENLSLECRLISFYQRLTRLKAMKSLRATTGGSFD